MDMEKGVLDSIYLYQRLKHKQRHEFEAGTEPFRCGLCKKPHRDKLVSLIVLNGEAVEFKDICKECSTSLEITLASLEQQHSPQW